MFYEEAVAELNSFVGELGPAIARNLVNRAWRDILDSRRWTFLKAEIALYTPALINVGGITATQNSAAIVGDVTAAAAWVAVGATTLKKRQWRIGLGPLYNISDFDGVNTLTLENAFGEPSVAGSGYQIQQFYYEAPADFLRWESVVDPISAYSFILDWTKEELDRADPQRGSQTLPHRMVSYRLHPVTKLYLFEMWPTPSSAWRYPALYQKKGVDLDDGDELPLSIPSGLVLTRSRYHAYEWAEANKSRHDKLKGVNWLNLRSDVNKEYQGLMNDSKRQDEEIFIQNYGKNYLYPAFGMNTFGANYWQSHAPIMGY